MLYRILADAVMLLHFAYLIFVSVGAFLLLWSRRWMWVHLPAVAWGVWVELLAKSCPLTPLENWLRLRAGQSGYAGGFIDHYIARLVYPGGLTDRMQTAIGVGLIVVNVTIYAWVLRRGQA